MNESTEEPVPSMGVSDRGIPSVASGPGNQKLIGGAIIAFALIVMVIMTVNGMEQAAPKSLTASKNVVFKTPPDSAPYIMPGAPGTETDPLAAQKQQAMQQAALRMALEEQKKMQQRAVSPQVVYDQQGQSNATVPAIAGRNGFTIPSEADTPTHVGISPAADPAAISDPNTALAVAADNKDTETVHAHQMNNLHTLIAQGAMIVGVLETAIQSDLPGMVRAIVSENIYSFDGTELLIPQGSRLVGEYKSGLVRGQSRVFIIWNRLIRNDGVSINIGSFGTDELGRSGLEGDTDTHFFERFGSSVMLSMIDSSLQAAANSTNSRASATVAVNTGNDFSNAATIALQNSVNIPPTISIDQGTRINVFVGKDLDFSRVGGNKPAE